MKPSEIYRLEQAQRALEDKQLSYVVASQKRNALILEALKAGVRPVDIARITGLSRARIAQLR